MERVKQMCRITLQSQQVFENYARDAINWHGCPPIGGNVVGSKEERGNLTQLKKAGLISTWLNDGTSWIQFTDKGKEFAGKLGIIIDDEF
jgi:hypothetical protein